MKRRIEIRKYADGISIHLRCIISTFIAMMQVLRGYTIDYRMVSPCQLAAVLSICVLLEALKLYTAASVGHTEAVYTKASRRMFPRVSVVQSPNAGR